LKRFNQKSVRPEPVEGLSLFRSPKNQGRPFDKLRANGLGEQG
jgi:hypothetical protein